MLVSFQSAKLSDYCDVFPGFAFKSEFFTDDVNDIPLVKGENLQQGYIDWGTAKRWPHKLTDSLEKFWLQPSDIVVAMDRPWVTSGLKWSYIHPHDPKSLLVQRVARLRAKNGLYQGFLRFLIGSDYFTNYVKPIVTGVNVPHISGKQIGDFLIPLPPLPTQKKIAAVLSAYDDLIENNTRRIALLERMAEELYKEWFVRMRFPDHEQTRFVKGIPEGWDFLPLSDVVDFQSGFSFKSNSYLDKGIFGIVTIKNVQDGFFVPECSDFINEVPSNVKSYCLLKSGDILLSLTGNVGRVCHVYGSNYLLNQRVAKVSPKINDLSQFIYLTLRNQSFSQLMINLSLGSTAQLNLSPVQLGKEKLILPNDMILRSFEQLIQPLMMSKLSYLICNQNLKQTRDRLLTRLISGKLSVEDRDISFPPSMLEDEIVQAPLAQKTLESSS